MPSNKKQHAKNREHIVGVRLTTDELKAVAARANKVGVPISTWIRMQVILAAGVQ